MKPSAREIVLSELFLILVSLVLSIIILWPIQDLPIIGFFIGAFLIYVFSHAMYIIFQITLALLTFAYHFFKGK